MSEDIKHHIKIYWGVFIALLILTVLTVAVSYIHFSYAWLGLLVGLLVACVKGYLVASEFMHLKGEKKMDYWYTCINGYFLFCLIVYASFM